MGNAKPECNQCIKHYTFKCLIVHSLKKKQHEKKIDVCNVKFLCLIFIMQLRKCLFCFHLKYLNGCHLFAPKDSKWYSLVHSFVPNLTHLFFFSNWVDLLPNLTHFEKTNSSLGKDLVQKNGLTKYSLKAI